MCIRNVVEDTMSQLTTTVYYHDFEKGRELREKVRHEDDWSPTQKEFEELYEEKGSFTVETDDPTEAREEAWRGWNRGSGYEQSEFLTIECTECGEEFVERQKNHDEIEQHRLKHVTEGHSGENLFDGNRSMMVTDIVVVGETAYLCEPFGWNEIDIEEND